MEKAGTAGAGKKTQDDSAPINQDIPSSGGGEVKTEASVEKSEKEEGIKNEGTPGNQRKERNSTTPKVPSRSTRSSNNPEFVAKQRHFLQKVNQGVFYQSSEEESEYSAANGQSLVGKRKRSVSGGLAHSEVGAVTKTTQNMDLGIGSNSGQSSPSNVTGSKGSSAVKKRRHDVDELSRDIYCWVCHREVGNSSGGSTLPCEVCPRVYHARCCHSMDPGSPYPSSPSSSNSNSTIPSKKGWACPECVKIVRAETMGTRSRAMQLITMDQLCTLLKFVLTRVRAVTGAEPFYGAVDLQQFPRYREFVANPMDLGLIDRNIRRRTYGSTEAFFADMKWLVHNSIIFNTQHSKLTSIARSMLKICRQELMEIENCPDCYSNAHTRKDNWFIDVCRRPHILVWAKLKGFPHWPAKAMRVNKESCVDVRFFGAHDRAWVPARDCFLYSREMPAPPKNRKKNNFDGCIMEVEDHIKKLKDKYSIFVYAQLRTVYDPSQDDEILMKMLPKYQPLNMDNPSGYGRENLQVEHLSRESPSMSTGTEEESDRDQSIDEDLKSSRKREYDATFEDSMEIPSACDTSQSGEIVLSSTKPTEDGDKVVSETASESEGTKESKVEVEGKDSLNEKEADEAKKEVNLEEVKAEVGTKEEKRSEKETGSEEEGRGTRNEKEEEEAKEGKEKEEASSGELPQGEKAETVEVRKEEEDIKVVGDGGVTREKGKRNGSTGEVDVDTLKEGEGKGKEEGVVEEELGLKRVSLRKDSAKTNLSANKEVKHDEKEGGDTKCKEVTVDQAEAKSGEEGKEKDEHDGVVGEAGVDDLSNVGAKEETDDKSSGTIGGPSDNGNDKGMPVKKVMEKGDVVAESATEGGGDSIEEEKEISNSVKSPNEMQGENTQSSLEEAEKSIENGMDLSHAERAEKSDTISEKCVADPVEGKEKPIDEKSDKVVLDDCESDDSADDKLDALIGHNIEPEIHNIIKSACSEEEVMDISPSAGSVKKQISDNDKSVENSCEKTENVTLDRDGEESRAKLFQSLRLVNIETLYKNDSKKGNMEEDRNKKDSLIGALGSKFEMSNKIDVNKLRESLMTKCASSAVSGSDLSHANESSASKNNTVSPSVLTTEEVMPESGDEDLPKKDVNANMEIDGEGVTSDQPAKVSVTVTSPASNKGDVGSQLRVLGKLQQRLSFIKETTIESDEESAQEKEDENTAEDADSVTGDASGSSNSDDEDATTLNDHSSETEKESVPEAKTSEKSIDGTDDVNTKGSKGDDDEGNDAKCLEKEEKQSDECMEEVKQSSEILSGSEIKSDEDDRPKGKRRNVKSDKTNTMEVGKVELESGTKQSEGEPEKPSKAGECAKKEGNLVQGRKSSSLKGRAMEINDSGRASPMTSKRQKVTENKDSDSLKARASPFKAKPEEVIEEEVLNREVLKESNMVVVQKTVKTRRLDEESGGGSAPKRARKGIVPKNVARSESPSQDEVFPSMFLDPSVTITVLQEAEKENGGSKDQSSNSSNSEEVRPSVSLSNDVSLTMVHGSGAMEGLAAVQDGTGSRSSEHPEAEFAQSTQNSAPPQAIQFRPRARKSFPRPSPRVHARSPQMHNNTPCPSPGMEVRRLSNSRDSSPKLGCRGVSVEEGSMMNMATGISVLKTATPINSLSPMPVGPVRGASAPPQIPLTSVNNFSPLTFSTPSTSQGLVRTVVSPVMPPTSLLLAQSNCTSPRLPTLCPRPPSYPLSGPQPLFTPSEAGPMSAEFNKHAHKLSCYMRQAIEDILGDLSKMGNPEATIKSLRLEVEKLRWEHTQEIAELKHNHDLVISEIKSSWEKEKMRLVNDIRRQCETEKLRAIEETKRKQWCANCSKEALFYCCWNTSYCDYPCQQTHWPRHMASCAQNNGMPESGSGDANSSGNRKDSGSGGHRGVAPPPPFHQEGKAKKIVRKTS